MNTQTNQIKVFKKRLRELRLKVDDTSKKDADVSHVISWLQKIRKINKPKIKIVSLPKLINWQYYEKEGIVRHHKGEDHFFYVKGVLVESAKDTEVSGWDQPLVFQREGGFLVILCQEREGEIKFLLQAKFEAGNIDGVQLAPSIQATNSNLKQHHMGRKPLFSEYINHPKTVVIYSAKHNEEGARFWQKSNVNSLVLLNKDESLPLEEHNNFIWLTLPEIKALMLYDNIVNPFVKTILSPL